VYHTFCHSTRFRYLKIYVDDVHKLKIIISKWSDIYTLYSKWSNLYAASNFEMKNSAKYLKPQIADIGFSNRGDQYLKALNTMFNLSKTQI